jgi:hypothetical protein
LARVPRALEGEVKGGVASRGRVRGGCGVKVAAVIPTTEVIPSRGVRALEGEGRGLSHLEVIARGRLWRQLAGRGIDRGAQRVTADLFVSILLFL